MSDDNVVEGGVAFAEAREADLDDHQRGISTLWKASVITKVDCKMGAWQVLDRAWQG